MKVLFVCSGNSPHIDAEGGIVPFIRRQGESLQANGVAVDFFSISGKGLKGYLNHVPLLKKHLKENKYDVIHAHYGLCGWVAVLAARRLPVVVSFMGDDLYGDADARGKPYLKDYIFIAMGRLLQYFVDHIIVKSPNLARWIGPKKKMDIIPNGVDFENFQPMDRSEAFAALGIPEIDANVVLFLGEKENPRKNFPLLEQALKIIKESHTSHTSHPSHPIGDITLLQPFPVQGRRIPYYLNAADVMVMTSYKEGSPNVVKEAMACNCPVVSTEVGDVRDVIGNTAGCSLIGFDPQDAAEKILAALSYGKRTNGRKDIAHLDQNQIAQKLIKIYNTLKGR